MNRKQLIRITLQISIVMSLLIANTSLAAADGGDEIIGQVSKTVSKSIPKPTKKVGITPDLTNQISGGGTAVATNSLSWSFSVMYGKAISSLSSDTVGTLSVCATATQLYMDGTPQGGGAQVCGARGAGGSVTSTKNKTVVTVFGHTWQLNTNHGFSKPGYSWYPSITNSVSL